MDREVNGATNDSVKGVQILIVKADTEGGDGLNLSSMVNLV